MIHLFFPIIVISVSSSCLLAFGGRFLAWRLKVLDYPDERKIHREPKPLLGGLALLVALQISLISLLYLYPEGIIYKREILGLLLGASLITIFGIWDDMRGSGALPKFSVQALVAIIAYLYGFRIERITLPLVGGLELGLLAPVLTILWYCVLINAMNLIDGLDGLTTGVSAIAAVTIFFVSFQWVQPFTMLLALIIFGICLGFLPHNFHSARIFLGDMGSMLLGFLLGSLALISSTKTPALLTLLIPLLVLGIPLFDTIFAFFRRSLTGQHPFRADKLHLHHRLLSLGYSHRRVVLLIYYISAYLGLTAFILSKGSPDITFLTFILLALGLFLIIELLRKRD